MAHLSEENNYPDLAHDETFSALAGYDTTLRVASPHEVTMLVGDADRPLPVPTRYELETQEVPL